MFHSLRTIGKPPVPADDNAKPRAKKTVKKSVKKTAKKSVKKTAKKGRK